MKDKILTYSILGLATLVCATTIYYYTSTPEPIEIPLTITPAKIVIPSYSYLFKDNREPMTSNIVGYFAGGAFAWYVPDWLIENWSMQNSTSSDGMDISPKIRQNSNDFSDIIFSISTSSETFNALTLYENELQSVSSSTQVTNEVLLNQHTEGGITMVIETDTRIYHIQESAGNRTKEIYYIDGKGKTLVVSFEAKTDIFPQFSPKIQSMIEGIGELKPPQG